MEAILIIVMTIIGISILIQCIYFISEIIGNKIHKASQNEFNKIRDVEYEYSLKEYENHLRRTAVHKESTIGWITKEQYLAYLKSDEWKAKASDRRVLDNHECQYCGSEVISKDGDKHTPNVHHMHYRTLTIENINKDIITLCKYCHFDLHSRYTLPEMEEEIRMNGKFV